MPTYQISTQCNAGFGKIFKDKVGQVYNKADSGNYQKLLRHGDEYKAIEIAESKYSQQCKIYDKPSNMLSTTTLHHLIGEIQDKIKAENID